MRLKSLQNWGHSISTVDPEREPYKVPPLGLVTDEAPANTDEEREGLPMLLVIAFSCFVSGCIILLAAAYMHFQGHLNLPI